jgi:signal transduction histidine kinase
VRPIKVLRSATFRLALISASLSTLSAIVLFAVIYWAMTGYARSQLEAGIVSDVKALVEVGRSDGLGGLTEEVDRRTHAKQTAAYYLLLGNDGHVLAGNLPPLAPRAGWHRLHGAEHPRQDRDADEPTILAYGIALPGGGFVLAGRDAHPLEELRELIVRAFGWAGGVTVMLAIGSGLLVSTGFLRRVEAINRTTQAIIDGDLKRRVPTRDTGDEIDHLAGSLNRMLDRIGALMDRLRQVSNDIAHDLRTPLARIRQRLEDIRLNVGSLAEYEAVVDRTMAMLMRYSGPSTHCCALRRSSPARGARDSPMWTCPQYSRMSSTPTLQSPSKMAKHSRQTFRRPSLCAGTTRF